MLDGIIIKFIFFYELKFMNQLVIYHDIRDGSLGGHVFKLQQCYA